MLLLLSPLIYLLRPSSSQALGLKTTSQEATLTMSSDYALIGHVIRTIQSTDKFRCAMFCMRQPGCLSANFYTEDKNCDLNRKRREDADSLDFVEFGGCLYLEIKMMECVSNPCLNNGVCYVDYESNKCRCLLGYKGPLCEQVKHGYHIDSPAVSCKEIYDQEPSSPSGVYYFKNGTGNSSTPYQAYCFMGSIDDCDAGGWSLAMKIDGTKTTFHYNSTYWENKRTYDPAAGTTGFDAMETKMPFYWSIPITKLCLGMRTNHVTRWIELLYTANSLYKIISTNTFHQVNTSIQQWRSLVNASSLQTEFIQQGFNTKALLPDRVWVHSRARIGVVGNNEHDAKTPDSRIGFGMGGSGRNEDDTNSCGNEASGDFHADKRKVSIKAFCYILLQ